MGNLGSGVEGLEGLCLDLHRMTSCSGGSCKAHVRVGQVLGFWGFWVEGFRGLGSRV